MTVVCGAGKCAFVQDQVVASNIGVNGQLGRSGCEASKDKKRQRYGRDTGKVNQ